MSEQRVFGTPVGVRLGSLSIVPDGGARNFVLQMRAGRFHGFVLRAGEAVHGYVDRCPHMGLPLAQVLDAYLAPGGAMIACSWHGALFDKATGVCMAGPCAGQRLTAWPVSVADGVLVTL